MLNAGPQPVFSPTCPKLDEHIGCQVAFEAPNTFTPPCGKHYESYSLTLPKFLDAKLTQTLPWQNCTRFPYPSDSAFATPEGNIRRVCRPAFRPAFRRSMDVRSPAPYNEKNQSFGRN